MEKKTNLFTLMMQRFLLSAPPWMMQLMLKMMIAMPLGLRKAMFAFMMRQLFSTTDAQLQDIMAKMVSCAFRLTDKQSKIYAETRVAVILILPKTDGIRLVHSMAGFCKAGSLKDFSREQGMMQRAISSLPKEKQFSIGEVFVPADATGFLPIDVSVEFMKRKAAGENK